MPNPKPAILIATTLGIAAGIVVSVRPWAAYLEQREEAKAVRADLDAVRTERARLERDEARGRSSVGRETRAREAGYRTPNERDLDLVPEPDRDLRLRAEAAEAKRKAGEGEGNAAGGDASNTP